VSIDHEVSDWQTSGIGKSMVHQKNLQKTDRKPPVVPTFIKDAVVVDSASYIRWVMLISSCQEAVASEVL
jgi:hypothetical protein